MSSEQATNVTPEAIPPSEPQSAEQAVTPQPESEPLDVNKLPPRGALAFVALMGLFYVLYFFWISFQVFIQRGA